jgi:hypothetical protein
LLARLVEDAEAEVGQLPDGRDADAVEVDALDTGVVVEAQAVAEQHNVGSDVVGVRVSGELDDLLAARIDTLVEVLTAPPSRISARLAAWI